MPKVIPKNVADEMTRPYIDDAVDRQLKAADVPPRNKLDISFKDAGRTDDNKDYGSNQEAYEKNHGKLYEMTHNNTIPWKNYVVYIVLLSLLTCVFTFSKYMSGAGGVSTVAVAKFNVETKGSLDRNAYNVTVTNPGTLTFEDEDTTKTVYINVNSNSEVAVRVTISQKCTTYTGSFDKTSVDLSAGENQACEFAYTMNAPNVTGKTPDEDGYITLDDKLQFNVEIEQID